MFYEIDYKKIFPRNGGGVLTLLPPAFGVQSGEKRSANAEVWVRTELYFGTSKAGGEVTDAEFAGFVDAEVTRLFPDGLTLLTGYGQFKDSNGVLIRRSRMC